MAEEIKLVGKHETELKWASYYTIGGFVLCFLIYFILLLIPYSYYYEDKIFYSRFIIFSGLLFYVTHKCIKEARQSKTIRFLDGFGIFFKIFFIVLFFNAILGSYGTFYPYNFKIYNQDFKLVFDDKEVLPDNRSNYLKDVLTFIKKRRR